MIKVEGSMITITGSPADLFEEMTKLHIAIMQDETLMKISADAMEAATELGTNKDAFKMHKIDIKEIMEKMKKGKE